MFEVKPIAAALGAELHGVDLCTELQPEVYAEIRRLLIKHQVIFFRDQDISPQQHKALAESFGPVQTHPAYETVAGFPEITILESTAEKPSKIEMWHSDMTFRQHPPLGSVLRSKICPPKGGDTMWASMSAAYDGLSEGMQRFLSTLNAEHDFSYGFNLSVGFYPGFHRNKFCHSANCRASVDGNGSRSNLAWYYDCNQFTNFFLNSTIWFCFVLSERCCTRKHQNNFSL